MPMRIDGRWSVVGSLARRGPSLPPPPSSSLVCALFGGTGGVFDAVVFVFSLHVSQYLTAFVFCFFARHVHPLESYVVRRR